MLVNAINLKPLIFMLISKATHIKLRELFACYLIYNNHVFSFFVFKLSMKINGRIAMQEFL